MSARQFRSLLDTRVLGVAACFWCAPSLAGPQQDDADPMLLQDVEQFEGEVMQVSRVEQLAIARDGKMIYIQLLDLQLPQEGDPDHRVGQERMEKLLRRQIVAVRLKDPGQGSDQMIRGDVFLQQRDVRLDLIQDGLAAYCPARAPDPALAREQEQARKLKAGIWARYATVETACSDLAK